MAEVAFHFNVEDKINFACRLLRKAWRGGNRCMVVLDGPDVGPLDQALWTFSGNDFIPHARASAAPAVRQHSPILLGEQTDAQWPAQVLINLSQQVPAGIGAFERIVEVVSVDGNDKQSARQRWRHYVAQGLTVVSHDRAHNDKTNDAAMERQT